MQIQPDKKALAQRLYDNAGREISQNFDTMNANMALAAGSIAAVLTVLGAGELFGKTGAAPQAKVPSLSPISLIVLVLALPLVFRFFVRTIIAYQNFERFRKIQIEAWKCLTGERAWEALLCYVTIYVDDWHSHDSLSSLVWKNLKYGFMWVFAVLALAISWAFVSTRGIEPRLIAVVILVLATAWETAIMCDSHKRYFQRPSKVELQQLAALQSKP